MWGVGNEVLMLMPEESFPAFLDFYPELVDLVHQLDPQHPVIYREGEDVYLPDITPWYVDRPWLFYGMNVYSDDLDAILDRWPLYGIDRPLFITEFGGEESWFEQRSQAYLYLWQTLRSYGDYVLGGAPYAWT